MKSITTTFVLGWGSLSVVSMYFVWQILYSSDFSVRYGKRIINIDPEENVVAFSLEEIMRSPVSISHDDPRLINVIRKEFLVPPSTLEYNLSGASEEDASRLAFHINKILLGKMNGVFVECGAFDGETRSKTLFFEVQLGWEGILIEGDPENFKRLQQKQRKAWTVPACLSPNSFPVMNTMKQNFRSSEILMDEQRQQDDNNFTITAVQCFPLYSILLSMNTTEIDYFSLDIGGLELKVLKTIPFDKVKIKTLSVQLTQEKNKKEISIFLVKLGYQIYKATGADPKEKKNNFIIFIHPG